MRLVANGMSQKFLLFNLNTSAAQKAMSSASGSTAQPHFYLADIRAFPVALAPVVEQLTIVEEVERHLSVVDKLETVVNQNLKRAEKLRQSILKKAFEGKLVPQDATDEPAHKLLERIKAEKAKREAETKAKKKRKQPGKPQ